LKTVSGELAKYKFSGSAGGQMDKGGTEPAGDFLSSMVEA
jgi:hypothetical protein